MNEYLNAFLVGSSWPVFISFFLVVARIEKKYTYETYTVFAPLVFGLFNVFSLFLAKRFKLSLRTRFVLIGLLAPVVVFAFTFLTGSYSKTSSEWLLYAVYLFVQYFLVFNVIVYNLHKLTDKVR